VLRRLLMAIAPLAAALALIVPAAPPAQAAPPNSNLVLLWSRFNGTDEPHHIATLSCGLLTGTGSHPHPTTACLALTLAGGEPGRLVSDLRPCTAIYDPVGALIYGTWGGAPVFWTASYGNPCEMARETQGVMDYS